MEQSRRSASARDAGYGAGAGIRRLGLPGERGKQYAFVILAPGGDHTGDRCDLLPGRANSDLTDVHKTLAQHDEIPNFVTPKQTGSLNGSVSLIIPAMGTDEYEDQILRWRAKKYEDLVGENGWMALVGLFWL